MCVGENELILLCGKCKEEIKKESIGPCPCKLCSLWYCEERKERKKWHNNGMDRGTIQWM